MNCTYCDFQPNMHGRAKFLETRLFLKTEYLTAYASFNNKQPNQQTLQTWSDPSMQEQQYSMKRKKN